MKRNSAFTTWQCVSNQGGGCPCDPFLDPCSCRSRSSRHFCVLSLYSYFFGSTGLGIRVCTRICKPRQWMLTCLSWSHVLWHPLFSTIRACLGIEFFWCIAFFVCFFCLFLLGARFIHRDDFPVHVYKHQVRHLCLHEAGFTWPFCPLVQRHVPFNVVAHQLLWMCAVIHRKKRDMRMKRMPTCPNVFASVISDVTL